MLGTSSIGGLISGLDTQDLISQLMAVSRRRVDVVVSNQKDQSDKLAAFQSLNADLSTFMTASETLKDIDSFNVFQGNTTTTSTTYDADDLLTVSTTTDASPGIHTIEFSSTSQLAQARKLSSQSFSSKTDERSLSGDFVINGSGISISTSDSLTDIATLINNANSGSSATGVTATVLSVSSTDHRLIITSDSTGADNLSLLDASSGNILQSLGLTSSTEAIKTQTSDGAESDEFTNSGTAVGSLLGLSSAQSGSVTIAGTGVSIDLSSDSLTTIATSIDAVSGVSASVVSTTTDGVTKYKIDISGTTSFTDSNNILEALGVLEGANESVSEIHAGTTVNTTDGSTAITETDTFDQINGASVGTTDTITIRGTDSDGTAINSGTDITYDIYSGSYKALSDLLTTIEGYYTNADAYISDGTDGNTAGQIAIKDLTTGESQISLTLISNNEGGGSLDFGTISASTEGYNMQVTEGQDTSVKIDGVVVSKSTNSIDDVIDGVTLNLMQMESGKTVNLTVARDTDSIKESVNDFLSAYNTVIASINAEFMYDEEAETAGVLSGDSTLSTVKSILQSTITNTISLLPSGENALSLIGINSNKEGKLSLTDSTFVSKINSDFNAVKRIFLAEGTTTNSEVSYVSHTNESVVGEYAVTINTVGTQATATGSADLSSGIGATTDTITITDTTTSRVATISLDGNGGGNATSLSDIVNAINSELDTERTQAIAGSVTNTASSSNITSSTTFSSIDGTSLVDDDVITFTGTTKTGNTVSDTFTISDTSTDTIQDFLSALESAYDNTVSATINSGKIVLTDTTAGDSLLSLTITEPSGQGLDFGTVLTTNTDGVTGRYAMELTASSSGNNFVLTHDNYGSGHGFTIAESNSTLGAAGTKTGVDVAGTINGESATGTGQILTGDAPATDETTSIEGLVLKITSTTTGSKGEVKLTKGTAEQMYYDIDSIVNSIDGILTVRMDGIQDSIDNLQESIDGMEDRLANEQSNLEYKFVQLELNLSRLQSVSAFLSQQLGSLSKLL
ncbi:MAG: flagellar filament capping protein FliD [Planctomycetes bacterium]|nr:flagellar filament capping protein FliD [Planctomycetota bacterium]